MQSAARRVCPPAADKTHTCSLRSVFPDAHAAGENRSQLDSRLRARTLRGFFDKLSGPSETEGPLSLSIYSICSSSTCSEEKSSIWR